MTLTRGANSQFPGVEPNAVTVELAFDCLCPWSYVMKRRMERVIEQLGQPLYLAFRGFETNPEMPASGMPRPIYDRARCGNQSGTKRDLNSLCAAGKALGLDFDYHRLKVAPNTSIALQMLHYAAQSGQQSAALESIFDAYFGQGLNISHPTILLDLGEKVGLSRDGLKTHLEGRLSQGQVGQERRRLKKAGVRRVPAVIVDGNVLAQEPLDEPTLRRLLYASLNTEQGQDATMQSVRHTPTE